jgi:UDP-N-acetylmuramate dehydrogenase
VELCDRTGVTCEVTREAMAFGYDTSRLQLTGEVLLTASFTSTPGDPAALRAVARQSLSFRKRTQPLESPSAGCIFQNPQRSVDHVPEGLPWSAGALVDRAGLKGAVVGAARVATAHGNFIVNDGGATAADIRRLIERCRDEVRQRFAVELRDEIVYLGDFSA